MKGIVCAAVCLALVMPALGTLRPRRDLEESGLAPPPDRFFYRFPQDNETGEGAFFSRGMTPTAAQAQLDKRVVVEKPVVVPFGSAQDGAVNGSTYRARRFVNYNLDANKAAFLLYPYEFSYDADGDASSNETVPETFSDGAFISTLPSQDFPKPNEYYFHWVNMSSNIDLAKAKAVYDVNIAVLQISATTEDGVTDVTYESDQFCTIFYSYIWGKYSKCFTSSYDYDSYIAKNPTVSQNPYIMFVNSQNITNGVLSKTSGENRFGILIIPDIAWTYRGYISSLLSPSAANIRNFVSKGGVIMTSGKAAMLLEGLGLVTSGSFSTAYTMRSPKTTWGYGNGCDGAGTAPADESEDEFVRRTLCFTAPRDGNYLLTSITSAPLLNTGVAHGLTPVAWYDTTLSWLPLKRHDENTGIDSALPNANISRSYPFLMYKNYGKGYVVTNLGNPGYNWGTLEWIYNAFYLAGSRPLVLDNTVIGGFNRTIPALEQVKLQVDLKLTNYFTQAISSAITITVWYRNGTQVEFLSGTSACSVSTSTSPSVPSSILFEGRRFDCSLTSLAALSSQSWRFSVYIEDAEVTQDTEDVTLLWPRIEYTDPRGSTARTIEYGVSIGAAAAALLRAEMNIDPSSMYPLHADGTYVDNVMNCENKEGTAALNVKQISIVPLVTPIIDISDQIRLAHALVFDAEYYKSSVNKIGTFNYPYNANDVDYLEWDLLYNRSNVLCASWDEAVKLSRAARSGFSIPPAMGINPGAIMNSQYQTNNDNDEFLLRQADFRDADSYYEHATQRLMAFLDVNTAAGAKTYWPSGIPSGQEMTSDATRGKRRVLFARHDVFWWKKYPQPSGLPDRASVISPDRYSNPACGSAAAASVAGAFGNSVSGGLIPREWPNELLLSCSRTPIITPSQIETVSGGKAKLQHYLVGIDPLDGSEVGDFYGFDTTTMQYMNYPEVKFVKAFRSKFDVFPDVSRRGGDMVFTFGSNPWASGIQYGIDNSYIQIAADQISVYKIYVGSEGKLHIRFKRGNMPNENYGQASHLQMFIENADAWATQSTMTVSMDLYKLEYDVSSPSTNFEDWNTKTISGKSLSFMKIGAFSLPAVRLEFLLGDTEADSIMQPYELREPLVRYGLYEQELMHRAVHGSAEFHPINEPCLVTRNGGFSTVTHIGTSSVPFREYLTTETSLMIPASTETGRVEWKDIWGRHWVQNVRSTIFEYPPIPPPLRNFVMTTTYEMLTTGGTRLLDWRSEDKVDVRVQMKLLNNYPKWFEVTNCKANEVLQLCGGSKVCERSRIFSVDTTVVSPVAGDDYQWIFQGHNASYGICFRDPEVYLSGVHLSDTQRAQIQAITLCAQEVGIQKTAACQNLVGSVPTVSRRTSNISDDGFWNWAQQVLDYWPQDYIKNIMWDLTHYDYDDNWYDKAYKYHMDNNLPHLGHWIVKPENIIAFPLYKGLGYSMEYEKTYGNPKFSGKKGWWSDNLQNRDRTLVAGQVKSNDVSVGKASLIGSAEWIDITELKNVASDVQTKLGNVYTCRFNRRMPKVHTENTRGFFLKNVYENNVVPVPPDFVPAWQTGYDCSDGVNYTPDTISSFPNIVYTETARDWLYFAANLRGGALEDINVIYHLSPLAESTGAKFEGVTKVQDGGRFTYWNPANSRNSYLIVDNPVSNVMAIRNDIEMEQEVIPTFTTTFEALVFHHLTITDPEEVEREWELPVYTRSYGYGDFAASVYVGDAGTSCLLTPGGSRARVKYTLMNNAGFDINMLKNAINSTIISQEAINSNDLLFNLVHTLRQPDAYNFLNIEIPEEIQPYITIKPSTDVVGIAGLFFDFESINVVQLRDGWKGDYYLDLLIKSNFPDSLRGRMYEISVSLNENYFEALPGGAKDPTGIHDYTTIKLPPIAFGVTYNNALWSGKVFWTSGYATNVAPQLRLASGWDVDGAKFVTPEEVDNLRLCLAHGTDPTMSESDGEIACMEAVWASIPSTRSCTYSYTDTDSMTGQKTVNFKDGFASRAPKFPVPVAPVDGPDEAELHLLVRTTAEQLPSGYPMATHWALTNYLDWASKSKTEALWSGTSVHAKGAHLDLSWSNELLTTAGYPLHKQDLRPADSGMSDITVTVTNTGDYYAYNVNMTLNLGEEVAAALPGRGFEAPLALPDGCEDKTPEGSANVVLYCYVAAVLVPQSPVSFLFRISFGPDTREGAGPSATAPLNMHILASNAFGYIDLTSSLGERTVRQDLKGPYGITYTDLYGEDPQAVLTGNVNQNNVDLTITHDITGIKFYMWLSRLPDVDTWTAFAVTTENTLTVDMKERLEALGGSGKLEMDFKALLTKDSSVASIDAIPTVEAETNVYEVRNKKNSPLLFLLIIPGVLVPAAIGAAVFLLARGKNVKPAQSLGYGRKAAFVAQEMQPEPEPVTMSEQPEPVPEPAQPEPEPQHATAGAEPSGVQMQPTSSQGAAGAHGTALPYGPTYVRAGGRPVNIVDNSV